MSSGCSQKILSQAVVSVHIEVRPKYLVPDTNCFIDHLDRITMITASHVYTLMVPIVGKCEECVRLHNSFLSWVKNKNRIVRAPVECNDIDGRVLTLSDLVTVLWRLRVTRCFDAVLSELEGLSRGGKSPAPSTRSSLDPQHVKKVAQAAKKALAFLKSRPQAEKCVTTKGAVLSSTTFTTEDDSTLDATFKNDDKILATCLVLSKGHREQQSGSEGKLRDEIENFPNDYETGVPY